MIFWDTDSTGNIWMCCYEVTEDTPEETDCVRMRQPIGGLLFEPVPGEPNKCKTSMILEADLNGYIPTFV